MACPSTTFCVATGNTGKEWTTTTPTAGHVNGTVQGRHMGQPPGGTASDASGVACPSVTFCVAGEWKSAGILTMTGSTHSVRSSATYGTNDLLSTSSLVVGATTTTATYGYNIRGSADLVDDDRDAWRHRQLHI